MTAISGSKNQNSGQVKNVSSNQTSTSLDNYYEEIKTTYSEKQGFGLLFFGIISPIIATIAFILELAFISTSSAMSDNRFFILCIYSFFCLLMVWWIGVSLYNGKKWARVFMFFLPLIFAITNQAIFGPRGGGGTIIFSIIPLLLYVVTIAGLRNKVFFRKDMPLEEFKKRYLSISNKDANASIWAGCYLIIILSILYLFIGGSNVSLEPFVYIRVFFFSIKFLLIFIGFYLGYRGYKKIDSTIMPPIGGKLRAIIGMILPCIFFIQTFLSSSFWLTLSNIFKVYKFLEISIKLTSISPLL